MRKGQQIGRRTWLARVAWGKKLVKLTFQRAVFGHRDPIDKGASQAIAKLAATL